MRLNDLGLTKKTKKKSFGLIFGAWHSGTLPSLAPSLPARLSMGVGVTGSSPSLLPDSSVVSRSFFLASDMRALRVRLNPPSPPRIEAREPPPAPLRLLSTSSRLRSLNPNGSVPAATIRIDDTWRVSAPISAGPGREARRGEAWRGVWRVQ